MPSTNRYSFTSPIEMPSHFHFIFLPENVYRHSTMLNISGKSRHFCLVLLLGEKQSFSIKYDGSCGFFIDVPYEVDEIPF